MKRKAILLTVGLFFLMSASALAGVPDEITFMGRLIQGGNPVTSPTSMTFELFLNATGGSNVWSDTQIVTPNGQGVYVAYLGSALNPLPTENDILWIQVTVVSTPLTPRRKITSTPFALRAGTSDDVGTLPNLDVTGNATIGGNVGIGTASPSEGLTLGSGKNILMNRPAGIQWNGANEGIYADDGSLTTAGTIHIKAGGSERVSVQPLTGNVGIGTVNISNPLSMSKLVQIYHSSDSGIALSNSDNDYSLIVDGIDRFRLVHTDGGGNHERLAIDTAGKVGIGTTTMQGVLNIRQTSDSHGGGIFMMSPQGMDCRIWITSEPACQIGTTLVTGSNRRLCAYCD